MKIQILRVQVTFTEPLLATASGNPEIQQEFIASKANDADKAAEEIATIPVSEQVEKASTVFHRDENGIFVYDYTWRGFIKEAIQTFIELGELKKLNPWNHKKAVDGCVFVSPRRIHMTRDGTKLMKPDGTLQRPLRAMTMQGERVALTRSEYVNAGTNQQFEVKLLVSSRVKGAWSEITANLLKECFEMGKLKGHGQWRSGGFGTFTATVTTQA